jgi:hypothetical protein
MTTADDYALTEVRFWQLVNCATEILGGKQDKADAMRARIVALPWERRRFLYNSSPLEVASDLASVAPTRAQRHEFRRLEQRVIDEIGLHRSKETQAQPTSTHRYRIDVDRLVATA